MQHVGFSLDVIDNNGDRSLPDTVPPVPGPSDAETRVGRIQTLLVLLFLLLALVLAVLQDGAAGILAVVRLHPAPGLGQQVRVEGEESIEKVGPGLAPARLVPHNRQCQPGQHGLGHDKNPQSRGHFSALFIMLNLLLRCMMELQ